MSLAIDSWEVASREEWDRTWSGCAYATWFHGSTWAELWHQVSAGTSTPAPHVAVFSDGCRALVPLSRRRLWLGLDRAHDLCPAGTYGGWLSTGELSATHAQILTNHLVTEFGNLTWRLNPFTAISLPDTVDAQPDVTHAIDLRRGMAEIEARWRRSSNARKIRKARAAGVSVGVAAGIDDWRAYFEVYRESLQRWGERASSQHDWRLFEQLSALPTDAVRLWLARLDGAVVAGALCFYAPHHVAYWHGAARASAFGHRPVNLLMAEAIEHAAHTAHDWFDLNPSGGHHGVLRFKESLGASALPCPVVRTERRLRRHVRQLIGHGEAT